MNSWYKKNMQFVPVCVPSLASSEIFVLKEWQVREGMWLLAGQPVATLISGVEEIPVFAPQSGSLAGVHHHPGEVLLAGAVIGWIQQSDYTSGDYDPDAVLVYGGGGHGQVLLELIRQAGHFRLVGVVDDRLSRGETLLGVPVLGGAECLAEWRRKGVGLAVNGVGGIGNPLAREGVFTQLEQAGYFFPTLVHPRALVEPAAILHPGAQVLAMAYVGPCVEVGFGSLINVGAIASHHCRLGRVTNLSPGATLAGGVSLGDYTQVGMQATINVNIRIGKHCLIGNGATVKADVPDGTRVRAGHIWPPLHSSSQSGGTYVSQDSPANSPAEP